MASSETPASAPHAFEPGGDLDSLETREWLDALGDVVRRDGPDRARYLIERLIDEARESGAEPDPRRLLTTPYVNTIPPEREIPRAGEPDIERRIKSINRWNAVAMVLHANKGDLGLGGHIASYQSAATLFEVGFNHFFHTRSANHGGDLVFFQGHSSPGIYARAFLEGRITEQQLKLFRREVDRQGVSSYPHPWLMPGFWQFPTVSMGLGPISAIYQARFMKYLDARGLIDGKNRKVWAFLGDGEMDEPESLGSLTFAARERLDNLIFVVNCNLQRLDGPVRGNGKIIQELEGLFRGAGWNVIKVIWGSNWDPLLEDDHDGRLKRRMMEAVDGDYQAYKANDGKYVREHFFGKDPELLKRLEKWSDEDIWRLRRGGHDPRKVFAAYAAATSNANGQPTLILAKTIKGYGMGAAGEGQNITHQQKKMDDEALRRFRDRFAVPIADADLAKIPFYHPGENSPEVKYLKARREQLGGPFPSRKVESDPLEAPPLESFKAITEATGEREISTTMAFVRGLTGLLRDKTIGPRIVPIVADEARTFGMEGLFRQIAIYSTIGQAYQPVDHAQLLYYREATNGQILQEGINEAGSLASWIAAGTAYANHGIQMIPFFIFYSMFGFQRVADLIWSAADAGARGFLLGATSGRTTLNGEGLQHQDGHSHLAAMTVPTCVAYDPTYSYEVAVIFREGLRRMNQEQENCFYYVTLLNENYVHPELPKGAEEGILRGMYLLRSVAAKGKKAPKVQLMGCGSILREVEAAAEILAAEYGVASDVWSATSFTELRRDGLAVDRWNRLHPTKKAKSSYVAQALAGHDGPVIASTDYMKAYPDLIRPWVDRPFHVLGTDGFGRSDTREALRRFFEVDRGHVVVAALKALADEGVVETKVVAGAIQKFGIDPEAPEPVRS